MTISQRVFYLLGKQGKKQNELSEYTGISTSTISAWNKRGTNPAADTIPMLADFFGVSTDYLLTGEEKSLSANNINADDQNPIGTDDSFENINNGNTYNETANIAIGNDIKQTNFNMIGKQSSRSYDTDKIVQELDDMIRSLNDDSQRELLAAQVRNTIETFKKLLETSKKKQN